MSPAAKAHRLLAVGMVDALFRFDPERGPATAAEFVADLYTSALAARTAAEHAGKQRDINRAHAYLWVAGEAAKALTVQLAEINDERERAKLRHPSRRVLGRVPVVLLPRQRAGVAS